MSHISESKLDLWYENGFNVLFRGLHGVGKTSMVQAMAKRNKLELGKDWLYFSASTMDPWCDFIGVPKEYTDENGETYLQLVRPPAIAKGQVRFMMFDEINRSHKKIRNAIMELIQFRSINGKPFPNLKCIWAAANPEDDEQSKYDVEALDPAQEDRFEIKCEVPYKPDLGYLKNKYDESTATAAVHWWNQLDEKTKRMVSPRRLDYALRVYEVKGDLNDVLPKQSHVSKLVDALINGSPVKVFEEILKSLDRGETEAQDKLKEFLKKDNNFRAVEERIVKQPKARSAALKFLPLENVTALMANHRSIKDEVFANKPEDYIDIIRELAASESNRNLKREATKILANIQNKKNASLSIGEISLPSKECKLPTRHKERLFSNYTIDTNIKDSQRMGALVSANLDEKATDNEIWNVSNLACSALNPHFRRTAIKELAKIFQNRPTNKEQSIACLKIVEWYVSNTPYDSLDEDTIYAHLINESLIRVTVIAGISSVEGLFAIAPNLIGKYLAGKILDPSNNSYVIRMKKKEQTEEINEKAFESIFQGTTQA